MRHFWSIIFLCCLTSLTQAAPEITEISDEALNECLKSTVVSADEQMTISALKEACQLLKNQNDPQPDLTTVIIENSAGNNEDVQVLKDRLTMEALNRSNRFILTPHKRNYFLPVSYNRDPNSTPYAVADTSGIGTTPAELSHTETELQLSIKILLWENIFNDNGHLYLGYTNHALWQLYSDTDSAPFRETDHQPEFILSFNNNWKIFGFHNVLNEVILNHQSNGQGGLLSRSWNRLMLNSVFERGNFMLGFTPWYRLPEKVQEYPGDPHGDDNPNINEYLGNFELTGAYQHRSSIFSIMLRNNLATDNKGAVELGWTFPLSSNVRGHFKYFSGYGHTMIDYNANLDIVAFGMIFTDLF